MKRAIIMTLLAAACITMTGCWTFGNGKVDNPLTANPYQTGRTFVFVDVVTEPYQPTELALVISQVYAVTRINIDATEFVDLAVRAQINDLYADATPETREMIFNAYKALYARLTSEFEAYPELGRESVFREFSRGVNDALKLYKPGT